ncbi:MAG: MerR family transcriptional regulator [Lachnospiraceae bacterium]|nr:MerR family transcriptional regulator [Lachnospiraceae bacterium]
MNINELERLTGISKQNIRFYEKKELLHPSRNPGNNYREYSQEDVTTLKTIKLLRKLDCSLEDIHSVLSEEIPLHTLLEQHLGELQARQQKLKSCIDVCNDLLQTDTGKIDLDETLTKMDQIEENGGMFMSIIEDYKKYAAAQRRRSFSFQPDTMVMNPGEFLEALFLYANENNQNLEIIKEGMYPVFKLDGVEYRAERIFGRFGATVHCTMTHPEENSDADISEKRKMLFRLINGPYILLLAVFLFMAVDRQSVVWAALVALFTFPYLIWLFQMYQKNK